VLIVVALAYDVVSSVMGWHPVVPRVYLAWAVWAAMLSWWWLATGASVAAVVPWIVVGFVLLIAGLATLPGPWAGMPAAAFFGIWTLVSVWDPAKRIWQRVNAWASWPLFVAVLPADQRDRYRRYRAKTQLPRLADAGEDMQTKAAMLRATADRVRSLDAPSEPWVGFKGSVVAACELWADMLEGRRPWDEQAVLDAFAQRDMAWEQVLYRLSPWGWHLLMWGPVRRTPTTFRRM
jgi:hypothetical protein